MRGKLNLSLASQWTSLDLHRFVSHYLTVRFPICLALNKIDAFFDDSYSDGGDVSNGNNNSNNSNHKRNDNDDNNNDKINSLTGKKDNLHNINNYGRNIIKICQSQAILRGELAVPVSAFAENWKIMKQAYIQSMSAANAVASSSNSTRLLGEKQNVSQNGNDNHGSNINSNNKDNNNNDYNNDNTNNNNNNHNNNDNNNHNNNHNNNNNKHPSVFNSNEDDTLTENIKEEGKDDEAKSDIPLRGSRLWIENEATLERVMKIWLTTGCPILLIYLHFIHNLF